MTKNVLVYIEINNNKVEKVSREIISHALNSFKDAEINGLVIADKQTIDNSYDELKNLPLDKLFIISDGLFDEFNICVFSDTLSKFVNEKKPDILLMGATVNGRDLAPRTASGLDIGLTADCTDLQIDEKGDLLATRPTYGGKMMATIISKTLPNFATVRAGAFKENFKEDISETNKPEFLYIETNLGGIKSLIEILNCEKKQLVEDWTCAEVIVSGGLGLKTKNNFDMIYKLAELLDGKPAASRAVIEQGWAPASIQVGQTGLSVSPKLYLSFGISGAMQHMAGLSNADKIIAINNDKSAPIMSYADIAIVGDAVTILNSMIEEVAPPTQAPL